MIFYFYSFLLFIVTCWISSLCNFKYFYIVLAISASSLLLYFNNFLCFFILYESLAIPIIIFTFLGLNISRIFYRSVLIFFYLSYFFTFMLLFLLILSLYSSVFISSPIFVGLLLITFTFKAPLFPFYSWLIWLHAYADTKISIILASFYLKLSALIFICWYNTLNCFLLSFLCFWTMIFVITLNFIEILPKRLIALASIFHCTFGLFVLMAIPVNHQFNAFVGILFWLLHWVHALCAGLLFYIVGLSISHTYTKSFALVYNNNIFFSFLLVIFIYFSIPILISFLIEVLLFSILVTIQNIFILIVFVFILSNFVFLFNFLVLLYHYRFVFPHIDSGISLFYSSVIYTILLAYGYLF